MRSYLTSQQPADVFAKRSNRNGPTYSSRRTHKYISQKIRVYFMLFCLPFNLSQEEQECPIEVITKHSDTVYLGYARTGDHLRTLMPQFHGAYPLQPSSEFHCRFQSGLHGTVESIERQAHPMKPRACWSLNCQQTSGDRNARNGVSRKIRQARQITETLFLSEMCVRTRAPNLRALIESTIFVYPFTSLTFAFSFLSPCFRFFFLFQVQF